MTAHTPVPLSLANSSMGELLRIYNEAADQLDRPAVKRFSDRAAAEKRTTAVLAELAAKEAASGASEAPAAEPMKGHVRAADASHPAIKSITSVSGPALEATKAATAPAAAGAKRSIWRRAKHEAAAKIAYRPEPGTVQAQLYDILTRSPDGLTMEDYCAQAAQVKTKDSTLFTPSAVWGALRYLFVTNRGYGLSFDGTTLKLLVPADERQSSRKLKQG